MTSPTNIYGGEDIVASASTPEDRGDVVLPTDKVVETDSEEHNDDVSTRDNGSSGDDLDNVDGDVLDTSDSDDATDDEESDDATDDEESSDEGDEDEDEDEDEGDADKDSEKVPSEKKAPKNKIPVARLNKEIEKRQALERKLADMEAQLNQAAKNTGDPDKKVDELPAFSKSDFQAMQDAMLDDKGDEAFELFAKMMESTAKKVRDETRAEITGEVETTLTAKAENEALHNKAVELGTKFPELDSNSDYADIGLIEEVVDTRDVYIERGLTPAQALEKAVKLVALENSLVDRTAKSMSKPKAKAVDVAAKMLLAEKEKGKLQGSGRKEVEKEPNIANLTDEQFSKLDEEVKRRARGDYIG